MLWSASRRYSADETARRAFARNNIVNPLFVAGDGSSKVTFSLWGRNLFNEQYVFRRDPSNSLPGGPTTSVAVGSISNVLGDYGNFNAPRTFGVEGRLNF